MPGGRKRGFDDQLALQTAMELFWRQGYEGTSIADLTKALGINPPSLYAAFGSKRDLFEKTLDRYMCERGVQLEDAMAQPTAHEAVRDLLTGRVRVFTSPDQPAGCMTVQAGLSSGEPHHEIVDLLAAAREEIRQAVLTRLDKALADGDLPVDTNCTALARYVMAAIYGLSVEAASGAPQEELMAAAELAAQVVPRT
ncbi:TetR/AcrR family transcriptional regulator [Paenarthrobacter histidinolovorans]|uniref:TetR/AcrR family transcriptional regulator n=1 Tax=Paenarthrobacter histidinolovorans TaxID=43664 RepID=UPI00166743E3|nr:TetR/AcrR family transcriptional regulator [Paenarthrobacter histidinolovorans]GGJ21841.1 TetR family transcriptional regulator [Paenarthrobacter histidinolovorans]